MIDDYQLMMLSSSARVSNNCIDHLHWDVSEIGIIGLVDTSERDSPASFDINGSGLCDRKNQLLSHLAIPYLLCDGHGFGQCIITFMELHFCTTRLQYVVRVEVTKNPLHGKQATLESFSFRLKSLGVESNRNITRELKACCRQHLRSIQ